MLVNNSGGLPVKDQERDLMRRIVLEMVSKGQVIQNDLEKKAIVTCDPSATTNTFKSQLRYLLSNGYINRFSRSIYQIKPRGENYLALLAS